MGPNAFDFWLGEWDCATEPGPATNSIAREYGDNVIVERFRLLSPQVWTGMSVSVFTEYHQSWYQTWVDQDANYWHLEGRLVEGNPCFATPGRVDRDQTFKRMIFSDIKENSLHWRWEISNDGETWTPRMTAKYTRRH